MEIREKNTHSLAEECTFEFLYCSGFGEVGTCSAAPGVDSACLCVSTDTTSGVKHSLSFHS